MHRPSAAFVIPLMPVTARMHKKARNANRAVTMEFGGDPETAQPLGEAALGPSDPCQVLGAHLQCKVPKGTAPLGVFLLLGQHCILHAEGFRLIRSDALNDTK